MASRGPAAQGPVAVTAEEGRLAALTATRIQKKVTARCGLATASCTFSVMTPPSTADTPATTSMTCGGQWRQGPQNTRVPDVAGRVRGPKSSGQRSDTVQSVRMTSPESGHTPLTEVSGEGRCFHHHGGHRTGGHTCPQAPPGSGSAQKAPRTHTNEVVAHRPAVRREPGRQQPDMDTHGSYGKTTRDGLLCDTGKQLPGKI